MSNGSGLRGILVAGALVVLAHGLILRAQHPVRTGPGGRPHDGRSHPSLFAQAVARSRDDEIREMFEFAQAPTDYRRCVSPPEDDPVGTNVKHPTDCAMSSETAPRASYIGSAIINSYPDESVMNGGVQGGIGAFESLGFGGSTL